MIYRWFIMPNRLTSFSGGNRFFRLFILVKIIQPLHHLLQRLITSLDLLLVELVPIIGLLERK